MFVFSLFCFRAFTIKTPFQKHRILIYRKSIYATIGYLIRGKNMEKRDLAELVDEIRQLRKAIEGISDNYYGAVRVKVVRDDL